MNRTHSGPTILLQKLLRSPITILYVGDDPHWLDFVRTVLQRHDSLDVRTETAPDKALEQLETIDCLASDYVMPTMDGLELLGAVRTRDHTIPFVLVTHESLSRVADELLATDWTDYVQKNGGMSTVEILAKRSRHMVEYHRALTVARHAIASAETSRDGVAIIRADGTYEYVNPVYATTFDYEREELLDLPWHAIYADGAVDRLEKTIRPSLEDDWRWAGDCVGLRKWGETFTVQLSVTGLEDGGLVISICGHGGEDD